MPKFIITINSDYVYLRQYLYTCVFLYHKTYWLFHSQTTSGRNLYLWPPDHQLPSGLHSLKVEALTQIISYASSTSEIHGYNMEVSSIIFLLMAT